MFKSECKNKKSAFQQLDMHFQAYKTAKDAAWNVTKKMQVEFANLHVQWHKGEKMGKQMCLHYIGIKSD